MEAEAFRGGHGWDVIRGTEGYFPALPNLWSADRLRAPAGARDAWATNDVTIPEDGTYAIWARYECPYGFDVTFRVEVEQAGAVMATGDFGSRDRMKYFPNGRGWQLQGPWEYHNTDQAYERFEVRLRKGPAHVTLRTFPGRPPEADRVLDLLFLTNDTAAEPGNEWSGKLDSNPAFLQRITRPVYCKIKVGQGATAPATVEFNHELWAIGYYNWGRTKKAWVAAPGLLTNAPPQGHLAPGQETPWMGLDLPTVLPTELRVTSTQPAELLISHHPGGQEAVSFHIGKQTAYVIVGTGNTRYERELLGARPARLATDYLEAITRELEGYVPPGKRAEYIGMLSSLGESALGADVLRLAAACGVNGRHEGAGKATNGREGARYGFIPTTIYPSIQNKHLTRACYEGDFSGLAEWYKKVNLWRGAAFWNVAEAQPRVKLLEECGPPRLTELRTWPKVEAQFKGYLRGCGIEPATWLGLLGDTNTIFLGTGTPEEATSQPERYYHSAYFRARFFADHNAAAVRLAESIFGTNSWFDSGSIYPSLGMKPTFEMGVEPFMLFQRRAATSYSSETTWGLGGTPDYLGPQSESYGAALGRALSRYCHGPRGNYLITDGNRGYTGEFVELAAYAMVAQRFDWWAYFTLAYPCECNVFAYPGILKAMKRVNYAVGAAEDKLVATEVVPAKVALGWSITTDIWDVSKHPSNKLDVGQCVYPQERQNLYVLLRHAQIPVDIVGEEDLSETSMDGYRMYVLVGDHLTRRAAQSLKNWVAKGGYLVSVAGGGLRDEYDRPLDTLNEVFGISGNVMRKDAWALRPKLELLHATPLDRITFKGGRYSSQLAVYGFRQSFKPGKGEVLGTFENGEVAAVSHRFGKGRALIVGALPGAAYMAGAFPVKPFGRGGEDLSQALYPSCQAAVRSLMIDLVRPDPDWSTVVCNEPMVEAYALANARGEVTQVSLVNFSGKPVTALTLTLNSRVLGVVHGVEATFAKAGFTEADGQARVVLPLDKFDVVTLQR